MFSRALNVAVIAIALVPGLGACAASVEFPVDTTGVTALAQAPAPSMLHGDGAAGAGLVLGVVRA